jgi:hypothetical protein
MPNLEESLKSKNPEGISEGLLKKLHLLSEKSTEELEDYILQSFLPGCGPIGEFLTPLDYNYPPEEIFRDTIKKIDKYFTSDTVNIFKNNLTKALDLVLQNMEEYTQSEQLTGILKLIILTENDQILEQNDLYINVFSAMYDTEVKKGPNDEYALAILSINTPEKHNQEVITYCKTNLDQKSISTGCLEKIWILDKKEAVNQFPNYLHSLIVKNIIPAEYGDQLRIFLKQFKEELLSQDTIPEAFQEAVTILLDNDYSACLKANGYKINNNGNIYGIDDKLFLKVDDTQ